jgi:hypothetical protein
VIPLVEEAATFIFLSPAPPKLTAAKTPLPYAKSDQFELEGMVILVQVIPLVDNAALVVYAVDDPINTPAPCLTLLKDTGAVADVHVIRSVDCLTVLPEYAINTPSPYVISCQKKIFGVLDIVIFVQVIPSVDLVPTEPWFTDAK